MPLPCGGHFGRLCVELLVTTVGVPGSRLRGASTFAVQGWSASPVNFNREILPSAVFKYKIRFVPGLYAASLREAAF